MFTRQTRLANPRLIKDYPVPIAQVSLQLHDHQVFHGSVTAIQPEGVQLKNASGKIRFYDFQDIDEIYIDLVVAC